LHGVQNVKLSANQIGESLPARFVITTGIPKVETAENVDAAGAPFEVLATEDLRK